MTPPKKRKRSSLSQSPQHLQPPQQQQPPLVALPPPLVPYHPHSPIPGHPHMVPMMSYPVYHTHAQPQYYIPVPSPTNTLTTSAPASGLSQQQPHPQEQQQRQQQQQQQALLSPVPSTSTTQISPRYERILPKRPSDVTVNHSTILSPTLSPSGSHPSTFGYSLQPSPLSLPHHPSAIPLPSAQLSPSSYYNQAYQHRHSTADQREQARKISHSAIERRRRERINDKIMQLKQIIPTCVDQENLHKMSILQSAIDYIQYLKSLVEDRQQRKQQCEKGRQQSHHSSRSRSISSSSSSSISTSSSILSASSPPQPPQAGNSLTDASPAPLKITLTMGKKSENGCLAAPTPPTPTCLTADTTATTTNTVTSAPSTSTSTSTMEPLKPIDVMKSHAPFQPSSPPCSSVTPTSPLHSLSLEKNMHMKLDNILS